MKKLLNSSARSHYVIAFFSTLILAIGLIIYGAVTPPKGEVSGSLITAIGVVFFWPALAFANKALEEGKTAKVTKGNMTISVGDIADEEPNNNEEEIDA